MADKEQNSVGTQFHREGEAFVLDTPPDPKETTRQRREDEQHEFARTQVQTNRRLAWFTGALVVATFFTIAVGIWQGSISQKSANAAKDAAQIAKDTLEATKNANAQQRLDNIASAADAKLLADRTAAQADKSLQATIDNFHLQQRAWVTVTSMSAKKLEIGDVTTAKVDIKNTGTAPAFDVEIRVNDSVELKGHKLQIGYGDTNKNPPASRGVLPPGGEANATAPERLINGTTTVYKAEQTYINALVSGEAVYTVFGIIKYKDVFRAPHQTTFCAILNSDLTTFHSCADYNNAT